VFFLCFTVFFVFCVSLSVFRVHKPGVKSQRPRRFSSFPCSTPSFLGVPT
jgi:hypothetical protein